MPEGAEYRREQRLERERGGAGGDCWLAERSGGARTPAWGGWGAKREESRRSEVREKERKREGENKIYKEVEREREKKQSNRERERNGRMESKRWYLEDV